MGTTGTIMGVSRYLKERTKRSASSARSRKKDRRFPVIRKWPEAYLPKIFDKSRVDQVENVSQAAAEQMARRLAAEEGIFCGISAAGACEVACASRKPWRTRRSCSSSATAATATCRPVCSPRNCC